MRSEEVPHSDPATQSKIDDAYTRSRARGFIPYCTVRELGYLTVNPGHEPVATAVYTESPIPAVCSLMQNYPNPFNPKTTIRYQLSTIGRIKLDIVDVRGVVIRVLVDETQGAGVHRILFNASDQASGVYFIRLNSKGLTQSRKILLLR